MVASWVVLGRLLGRLRGDQNVTKITCQNKTDFGPQNGPTVKIFGSQNGAPRRRRTRHLGVWKLTFFWHVIVVTFWSPLRRPKRRPRGPKTPPRAPKEAPRGKISNQDAPRRFQETPKAGQEGSIPSKIAPRGSKRRRGRLTSLSQCFRVSHLTSSMCLSFSCNFWI